VDTSEYPIVRGEYFFNTDPGEGQGQLFTCNPNLNIDIRRLAQASGLPAGVHKIGVRVMDVSGAWSTARFVNFTVITVTCTLPEPDFIFTQSNAGSPVQFTAQNTGTHPGTIYSWDILANGTTEYTSQDAAHTFSAPGLYDVLYTVDNGSGCVKSAFKQVMVGPLLDDMIQLSGPSEFCSGESVTITAPPGTQYLWNSGQTSQSIMVNETGFFKAVYTDLNGTRRLSQPVSVVVRPSLITTVTTSPENDNLSNGSAHVEVRGGNTYIYSYNWSGGQTTSVITDMSSGTYTVSVSDPYCPAVLNVNIGNVAGMPQGIIAAEYFTIEDPGPGNGNPITFSYGEQVNSYFSIDLTGFGYGVHILYVRVRSSNGFWSLPRQLTVLINDPAVVPLEKPDIVAAQYFFDQDPGVSESLALAGITPDTMINVSPTFSFNDIEVGLHRLYVRVKNEEGNWSQAFPIEVLIEYEFPAQDSNEYPVVWAEIFFNSDPGVGNGLGRAIPPGMSINILRDFQLNNLPPGNYTGYLRVKTLNNQWSMPQKFSFSIFQTAGCMQPQPNFTYINTDAGMPMQLTGTSTGLVTDTTFKWDILADGNEDYTTEDISHTFPAPGLYQVKLTVANSFLCFKSIIKEVEVGPYPGNDLLLSDSTFVCGGDSLIITAPLGSGYVWSNGLNSQSIVVKNTGTYQVYYTDINGTPRVSEAVSVEVNPEILVAVESSAANDGENNGSANVFVSGGNTLFYNYNWSNGGTQAMQTNLSPGPYTVTVSDLSCEKILSINISDLFNENDGIIAAEYFLGNTDPGPGNGLPIQITRDSQINSFFILELGPLEPGIYNFYARVKSANGFWSVVKPILISVSDDTPYPAYVRPDLVSMEYRFGTADPGEGTGTGWNTFPPDTSVTLQIPISVASEGYGPKSIYFRFKDTEGQYSIVKGGNFQICDQPVTPAVSDDVTACAGSAVTLSADTDEQGITYFWEGPGGFTSTQKDLSFPDVMGVNAGTYKAFTVLDGNCYSIPAAVVLVVDSLPADAGTIYSTATECKESTVFFVPFINNATNYEWTFPGGISIFSGNNTNNIAVTFEGFIGSFDLRVRGSNSCGTAEFSGPLNVNTCFCREVKNGNDGGLASLRNAVGCANPVDTIDFAPAVLGQFINISTGAIEINKDIVIQPGDSGNFNGTEELLRGFSTDERIIIINNSSDPIFNVAAGKSLKLSKVDLYVGEEEEAKGIITSGTLTLKDTSIFQKPGPVGTAVISNPGASIFIEGSTNVLIED
jgi:PKD repeat protein